MKQSHLDCGQNCSTLVFFLSELPSEEAAIYFQKRFHQTNSDDTTLKHKCSSRLKELRTAFLLFEKLVQHHELMTEHVTARKLLITKKKSKRMQSRQSLLCLDKGKLSWWNKELKSYRGTDTL